MAADESSGRDAEARRTPERFTFDAAPRVLDRTYSRYVRGLKLFLPAAAAMIVILVFAWPQLQMQDPVPDPESLRIRPQDTADLSVHGVRYVGTDARNRQFTVTAASTRQATVGADEVALDRPEADMNLHDGGWVALRAESGVFNRDRGALDLTGTVRFLQDGGFEISTDRASIDFRGGEAEGNEPVSMNGPSGTAHAEGFKIFDHGRRVLLTGKASMQFTQKTREDGT